jgi:dienelactone hydrolase
MVVSASLAFAGCGSGEPEPSGSIDWNNKDQRAAQFVLALVDGDYAAAASGFDTDMRKALGTFGLQRAWEATVKQAGGFLEIVGTEILPHEQYEIYEVTSRHELSGVKTRIVFSTDGRVAGLFFSYVDNDDWDMTPVVKEGYTDIPIILGEGGDYPLNGWLSMPDGVLGAVPAVVLVHGSGPSDKNETISGITVFADIADYLAKHGVAVLRYDKRTYAHGSKVVEQYGDQLTVKEETIDDAVAAKNLLAADVRIDSARIYVVGHSLGGMLAPRIVAEGDFAGAVIMAGSPRSLIDIIEDQNRYFIALMDISEAERDRLLAEVEQARKDRFTLPAVYIEEMDAHPVADYLTTTNKPFLILQGSKDFQVYADVDFVAFQQMTAGQANVSYGLYEGLTHLFTKSTMDQPTLDDYLPGSTVDPAPLADIVAWLLAH